MGKESSSVPACASLGLSSRALSKWRRDPCPARHSRCPANKLPLSFPRFRGDDRAEGDWRRCAYRPRFRTCPAERRTIDQSLFGRLRMIEVLDQTDLTDRAARLVEAARKAGADAADTICVRGISLGVDVRLGKIEETQRSEGDDFTLRAF